jgi:hypothetical protein
MGIFRLKNSDCRLLEIYSGLQNLAGLLTSKKSPLNFVSGRVL